MMEGPKEVEDHSPGFFSPRLHEVERLKWLGGGGCLARRPGGGGGG